MSPKDSVLLWVLWHKYGVIDQAGLHHRQPDHSQRSN